MPEYAGLLIVVIAVTIVFRLVPGALWKTRNFDMGAHLLFRATIRRNRMRMPSHCELLTLDERQTYPWLYHQFIALLPASLLRRSPALPSAVIDALHASVVFSVAAMLAHHAATGHEARDAAIAGLLFATAPALLTHGIGPRAYEVTPRPLGELLFTLTLVLFGFGAINHSVIAIAGAAVASALSFLATRFSVQVMVFTFPVLASWTGSYALLALLPVGTAVALLLSKGRYRWIAIGQVRHLALYRRRIQYDHPELAGRNSWSGLWRAGVCLIRSHLRDTVALKRFASAVENNTYLQFAVRNVIWWLLLVAWASGSYPGLTGQTSWRTFLLVWAVAPLIPALVTSLRSWRFLGEAERYPEYGIAPACVLAAAGLPSTGWLVTAAFAASAPMLAYAWFRRWLASRRPWVSALDGLVDAIRRIPPSATILAIPASLAPTLAHETGRRFSATLDGIVWAKNYNRIFARYPWPSPDLEWWSREHGVDHVVVMRWYLSTEAGCETDYDLSGLRVLFDNGAFTLYARP